MEWSCLTQLHHLAVELWCLPSISPPEKKPQPQPAHLMGGGGVTFLAPKKASREWKGRQRDFRCNDCIIPISHPTNQGVPSCLTLLKGWFGVRFQMMFMAPDVSSGLFFPPYSSGGPQAVE